MKILRIARKFFIPAKRSWIKTRAAAGQPLRERMLPWRESSD
jgi:hypothetical protein